MRVHKIILEARSPVFHALLTSPMREGQEGRVKVCCGRQSSVLHRLGALLASTLWPLSPTLRHSWLLMLSPLVGSVVASVFSWHSSKGILLTSSLPPCSFPPSPYHGRQGTHALPCTPILTMLTLLYTVLTCHTLPPSLFLRPPQIMDIKAPVFRALLHFVYTDSLPEEHEGPNLDVPMAQHLLVAADQYQLTRLRSMRRGSSAVQSQDAK
eukprot:1159372-Pelagomonas_calceolata.AAC.5